MARPIVYVGPSLSPLEARAMLPDADVRPPVARGDLHRDREAGGRIFVVIDGVFAHTEALPTREVLDVLHDGAFLLGAASLGALRAAECWPAGMRGAGAIYRLFRAGRLDSDDEVAVAVDPDAGYRAVSLALINIRHALAHTLRRGLLEPSTAAALVAAARALHFSERSWRAIFRRAGLADPDAHLERLLSVHDLKQADARLALRQVGRALVPGGGEVYGRRSSLPFREPARSPGHDPLLGRTRPALERELAVWMLASGRYQRHVWPLVAGEPVAGPPEERPTAVRDAAAAYLARMADDLEGLGKLLWDELTFTDELHAELLRMYAVRTTAAQVRAAPASTPAIERARTELAIEHGAPSWGALLGAVDDGKLWGAIPMAWIEDCAADLALARGHPHGR